MIPSDRIASYLASVRSQLGQPYVWPTKKNNYSGKGLVGSVYPHGRDCSGTVTWALLAAGYPDVRAMTNCARMWTEWERTETPEPGDLCLYGEPHRVTHVMTLFGDGRVVGACGGGSGCTAPEIARELITEVNPNGACVQFRSDPHYRPDFLGYVRNPLRDMP